MDPERTYEALEKRITELEKALNKKHDEVQRLKQSFLSNISHEIRTPMHAIMGFSELLSNHHLGADEREEYTLYIQECCKNLLDMFENMIDAAMIESSELKLVKQEVEVNELMNDIYQQFRIQKHRMEKYSVALLMNTEFKDQNFFISTDPLRLKQILSGLIGNALKFTNKGVVEFGYYIADELSLNFYVSDSGQGGLAKAGQLLLDNFTRSGNQMNGLNHESVLGLRVSKAIIEEMGGRIWVEPNAINGSTFSFTIPLNPVKKNIRNLEFIPNFKQVI